MVLLAKHLSAQRPAGAAVEVIIIRSCQGFIIGTEQIQHLALGERHRVSCDDAYQLAVGGAALYVNEADDPTPSAGFTLTSERLASIEVERKMIADRDEVRAEEQRFIAAQRRALIEKFGG